MTEPTHARYSGEASSDARAAVLEQLADALVRHHLAEAEARQRGQHEAAYEHHGAFLLLEKMSKEAERR